MMNREQAIAYGKRTGCRYFVKNSNAGLLGALPRGSGGKLPDLLGERIPDGPWNRGLKVFVTVEKI